MLNSFHPALWRTFRHGTNLRVACRAIEEQALALTNVANTVGTLEAPSRSKRTHDGKLRPVEFPPPPRVAMGVPVAPMALQKGTCPARVVEALRNRWNQDACVVEVKYDGERMQVHVEATGPGRGRIVGLFSKSRRNSTADRAAAHALILEAVGLADGPAVPSATGARAGSTAHTLSPASSKSMAAPIKVESVILDSELLVYNTLTGKAEGFQAVQQLSALRSVGSHVPLLNRRKTLSAIPEATTRTIPMRHYQIVCFDVLYLNGQSLLHRPYLERRDLLARIVR
ncbi:hypothetical protein HK405_000725, partial [Cladochytrium tenue]